MPSKGISLSDFKEILSYDEMIRVIKVAARLGVRKIRITGGEPLIRKNLQYFIESVNAIEGIEDISLTTNGVFLKEYAHSLARAGLRRVNVSLDSLNMDRYRDITRGGDMRIVLEGIHEAEKAGLLPVKINMVPMKGINDREIEEFARLTLHTPYHVRFIEFMPMDSENFWSWKKCISTDEIKKRVSSIASLTPVKMRKSGPARYFRFEGASGVIGFISPLTHHFCASCNRLRLTSDGKLRPCLLTGTEVDLKSALRYGASDHEIERLLRLSIEMKPERHSIHTHTETSLNFLEAMSKIGG